MSGKSFWMNTIPVPPSAYWEDQFNYVGVPNPAIWNVVNGTPTVDGSNADIKSSITIPDKMNSIPTDNTFVPFSEFRMRINFFGVGSYKGFIFSNSVTGDSIELVQLGGPSLTFITRTLLGGNESTAIFAIPYFGAMHDYYIDWKGTHVKLYVDSILKATHNIVVPSSMMSVFIDGGAANGSTLIDKMEAWI